jgi:hypothetical protein
MSNELHTGDAVAIIGFYPRNRRARRRAESVAQTLRFLGLNGWVEEDGEAS